MFAKFLLALVGVAFAVFLLYSAFAPVFITLITMLQHVGA